MENPVTEAMILSEKLDKDKRKKAKSGGKDAIIRDTEILTEARRNLLGIEGASRRQLTERIAANNVALSDLDENTRFSEYPLFDIDCFSWRDDDGYPRLVPFSMKSDLFELGVRVSSWGWGGRVSCEQHFSVTMPTPLRHQFKDLVGTKGTLRVEARKNKKTLMLRARFEGIIPQNVRDEYNQVKNSFKHVYIVAEVPKWDLQTREPVRIQRPGNDPLLIGFDGVKYWLVASFDTTPLENYVEEIALASKKSE